MDWLQRMNQVLDYIEQHLEDEIDYDRIARISLCPSGLFQRMFSILMNMPLSEYIRRRRLSSAALDLQRGESNILTIAIQYGYDSPDAFTYAFKRLHGVTPSQAKNQGIQLKLIPRLSFQMELKGVMEMNYKIIQKDAFVVIGKKIQTNQEENKKVHTIPNFWTKLNQDGTTQKLCQVGGNKPLLGVCYNGKPDGSFTYLIGVEGKPSAAFESLIIPASTWAVFETHGPMPDAIFLVWKDIFQQFFPTTGYQHAGTPDFELYPTGDVDAADYRAEVWIPIVAKI